MILNFLSIFLILLKIVLGVIYLLGYSKKIKEVDVISITLLILDLFVVFVTLFTLKFITLLPFFVLVYIKSSKITLILHFIIIITLLLPFKGVEDYFERFHRFILSIYFLTYTAFLILL